MNLQELKNTLSTSFDLDVWKNILLNILGDKIEYFTSSQKIVGENILCGGHIGSVRLDDGKTLGIIDIEVDDHIIIKRNRKALRGMVKDYIDQQKIHALLVFFHNRNQDDYRVSYIVKQTYFTPEGEFIKHESEPKRYTFLLGKNESCTTAALRLFDLIKKRREGSLYMLDLTEAFSVEKLNKEFFDKYVKHYRNFCEDIINNDNCRAKEFGIAEKQDFKHDDNKPIRDYVKKMMGRLVFLYFLQKRGWMNGDYSYLHNLYKSKTEFHNDYLEQILEPLFFCVLNTKEDKRIPEKIANLGDVSGIPYLNGGLFEKDRLDYKEVVFKKSLFDDLFEFFSQYNFTIDENDPYDAEVGIDPEMLGHIFENLLEDNKDKGAFYTPKEIVQYMCKQSLVEYLKSKTKSKEWDLYIAKLIDKHILDESVQNNVDFISTISGLLTNVKICDPAIGSGAFPMGMLNELFHCRQILHGFTRNAKAFAPATIKREIIQDNIYGVDIEQGAVDIARLRFWLSLIVDADKASPLPNFDYKIVCGNSLITTFNGNPIDLKTRTKGVNANKIRDKKKQLYDLQSKFYNLSGNEKLEREVEIKQCLIEIIELQLDFKFEVVKDSNIQMQYLFEEYNTKAKKANAPSYINSQMAELQRIKSSLFGISPIEERAKIEIPLFDWKIIFSDVFKNDDKVNDKDGFDIVIGNPPYLKEGRASKAIFEIVKDSPYYQGKMDLWYMFACYGVDLLSKDGILSFIATNNWVTNSGASKMRDKIISDTRILQLADFGKYMIFESASIQTMVMLFQKNKSADDYCVDYRRIIGDAKLADVVSLLEKKESNNVEYLTPSLKRDKFKGRYITFSAKEKLLDTMSSNNNVIFLTAKEATNGIHPHYDFINNKTALLGDFNVGEGIFGLSKTELNQLNLSLE
ncbi:MAG: N-6 DNA methylase, partial [Rikenellaceae bacterium]